MTAKQQHLHLEHKSLTGIEELDAQHRAVLSFANEMMRSHDARTQAKHAVKVFMALSAHFAAEEAVMAKMGYQGPELAKHKKDHASTLEELRRMIADIEKTGKADPKTIIHWVKVHIQADDREFGEWLLIEHGRDAMSGVNEKARETFQEVFDRFSQAKAA